MKTLPLCVVVYDGPIARAYLECLFHGGFRVEKIVLLIQETHPATGKQVGRWLPVDSWRTAWAEQVQETSLNYWPRYICSKLPDLFEEITNECASRWGFDPTLYEGILAPANWEKYTEQVERVRISGFMDPRFHAALSEVAPMTMLFTGGGLLPAEVFNINGMKFLHVHPGMLPDVRGADGMLWSLVVKGQLGATCFFLDARLDAGDILEVREFEIPSFRSSWIEEMDSRMLYRSIFSFVDPVMRGLTLLSVVESGDLDELAGFPQDESEGVTFHFMHPRLANIVMQRLFNA